MSKPVPGDYRRHADGKLPRPPARDPKLWPRAGLIGWMLLAAAIVVTLWLLAQGLQTVPPSASDCQSHPYSKQCDPYWEQRKR